MIKKCLNTIRYGTAKARGIVILSLLFSLLVVGCVVCAIIFRQILLVFGAAACVFIVISLAQTLAITGGVAGQSEKPEKKSGGHVEKPEKKNGGQSEKPEKKSGGRSEKQATKKKRKKKRSHIPSDEPDTQYEENEQSEPQEQTGTYAPLTEEVIHTYDRKKVKKTLHRFKVRRDHRKVMIDRSEKLHIHQTPAYIWVYDKEFHILLIEEEPRHITIPLFKINEITYLKKQMVNEDVDYAAFKGKSVLADMFRPYLPDYTHSTVVDDLSAYKNLYGIVGDIYVTNRSAAALFDLLGVEFQVDDRVTMSNKVNIFFKDAYKSNILLRDNVIDANGYADRISNILDNLAHSTVSYAEFKDTLNLMIRNKLITQEFAMYYMGVRDNLTR